MEFFYHFDKLKKLTITDAGMRSERYTLVLFLFLFIFLTQKAFRIGSLTGGGGEVKI